MSETSSRVRLMANLQAAVAEAVSGTMEERGRGFASDRDVYKRQLPRCCRMRTHWAFCSRTANGRRRSAQSSI